MNPYYVIYLVEHTHNSTQQHVIQASGSTEARHIADALVSNLGFFHSDAIWTVQTVALFYKS